MRDKYWESDLFIQSGAPVYWHLLGGDATSLTSEWHQWMWEERILQSETGLAAADPPEPGGKGRRHPLFVNLGAGSCQPWGQDGAPFLADAACVDFARRAGRRARVTTVRDPVAAEILTALQIEHTAVACPAFLAAARHRLDITPPAGHIGVNLMPLGGHFDLAGGFDSACWRQDCLRLTAMLRRLGPLVFVAHDEAERAWMEPFAVAGERVFLAPTWRAYLDLYAGCALVVGQPCARGGLCGRFRRARRDPGERYPRPDRQRPGPDDPAKRPGGARGGHHQPPPACSRAASRWRPSCAPAATRPWKGIAIFCNPCWKRRRRTGSGSGSESRHTGAPVAALASVGELESPAFRGWTETLNAFAKAHDLRTFENWAAAWEYPWLWRQMLGRIGWQGRRSVDLGSEISPMPWFLATLGARVTLIETDPQWVPRWEALRARLGVDVDWHLVDSERLPLADAEADVLTSFSVIEHQPDKGRAMDEVARVLKPGGRLAISFDICEPDRGMTFPEWNGRALTLQEFEEFVWQHPAFDAGPPPDWNVADMPDFLRWNLRSAPHHNYVVGAAVLTRRAA